MSQKIDIDTSTLVRFWLVILGFLLFGLFLIKAWSGILVVGLALFLTLSIRPLGIKMKRFLNKYREKDNEKFGNILAFLIVVVALCVIILAIGPMVVKETSKFFSSLPSLFENSLGGWEGINEFGKNLGIENLEGEIIASISATAASVLSNLGAIVGSIGNVLGMIFMAIILTIFFLLEGPSLYDRLWEKLNKGEKDRQMTTARRVIRRMGEVVSTFMGKQVVIAIIDGTAVAFFVFLLSLIFRFSAGLAFPLGLMALVFYLIPMFGQFIGCILNTLVLLVSNPAAGLIFAILYLIYSQVEGNFIATKMQGDALNLSPLIVLVAIIIGTYSFGLIGAIIAIPIAGCVKVLIDEYPNLKELRG